jgi:hypothetical protein
LELFNFVNLFSGVCRKIGNLKLGKNYNVRVLIQLMFVGTGKAAHLLNLGTSRVRQLLLEGRVVDAKKVGFFWQIPLFNGMPKIHDGTRGPQGTWKQMMQRAMTRIHVNKNKLDSNRAHHQEEEIIVVRRGAQTTYCHAVDIKGESRLVYQPNHPLSVCDSAVLWIEVEPHIEVIPRSFSTTHVQQVS